MLFAQLQTVPGEEIKNFALIILAILGGAYYAKGIFTRSQKREVSFETDFTPQKDFDRLVTTNNAEHAQLFSKIGGVERGANERMDEIAAASERANQESREKLHQRINRISIGVARLCGKLNVPMPSEDAEI